MKKLISLCMLGICLSYTTQAQVDTAKTMTDTSMMDRNKTNSNRNSKQENMNRKKNMPINSNSNGTMNRDSSAANQGRKAKPSNSTPNK